MDLTDPDLQHWFMDMTVFQNRDDFYADPDNLDPAFWVNADRDQDQDHDHDHDREHDHNYFKHHDYAQDQDQDHDKDRYLIRTRVGIQIRVQIWKTTKIKPQINADLRDGEI